MNDWDEQVISMIGRGRSTGSRAASSIPEARISEMDSNGVLVSKPLKRVQEITETKEQEQEKEPIVIDLQSKAGSVTRTGINKARVIADFLFAKRY